MAKALDMTMTMVIGYAQYYPNGNTTAPQQRGFKIVCKLTTAFMQTFRVLNHGSSRANNN